MKKTKYFINKLDFLDETITKFNIKSNSFTIKKYKQFIHIFSNMKDFRIKGKCVYPIETLLLIIFLAKLEGEGDNCLSIARYAKYSADKLYELKLIGKNDNGEYILPSHDCFRYFLLNFDSKEIKKAFIDKIKRFLESIAELSDDNLGKFTLLNIDGQEFRGTGRSKTSDNPSNNLATLNIFDASSFVCLYSLPISKKDSEIPVARDTLAYLDLKNKVITADALHTQTKTAKTIINKHGDYVFRVKDNQKYLAKDIIDKFNKYPNKINTIETKERTIYFYDLPTNYIGLNFDGQSTYIKTISKNKSNKDEELLFISSLKKHEVIKEAIENRWDVENGLHKGKDFYLDEDKFRINDKTAVSNISVINNVILSLYKIAKTIFGIETMIEVKTMFKHDPIGKLAYMTSLISSSKFKKLLEDSINEKK